MTYEEYKMMAEKRLKINLKHLENGVDFVDLNTAYIDEDVEIGAGTVIGPCVTIQGASKIGENCIIGQNTRISESEIGNNTEIQTSVIIQSKVGNDTHIGPFAYLRPKSNVGNGCKVGDFVEIKNSTFGDGAKASHLAYIGDSEIGKSVNIGCGVVFVNYDGTNKHRSKIGNNSFIGCNTNLVSPVNIGDDAYIAAGSTVTDDVPSGALCIARKKQKNIMGWVEKRGLIKRK